MEINILKKLGEAGRRGEGGTIVYQKKLYILKNSLLKLSKFWKFLQCAEAHSGPGEISKCNFLRKSQRLKVFNYLFKKLHPMRLIGF